MPLSAISPSPDVGLLTVAIAASTVLMTGDPPPEGILTNDDLRPWLLMGSICGAGSALVFFPVTGGREQLMRVLVSFFFGFFFAPLIFLWRDWTPAPETLGALAFCVSSLAWMIVRLVRGKSLGELINEIMAIVDRVRGK